MDHTRGSYKNKIDRHQNILKLVNEQTSLSVTELSQMLGISSVTIRKDLDDMGKAGLITRVHGGATRKETQPSAVSTYSARMDVQKQAKKDIAAATANLIQDGDSVLINVGSTGAYVCEALKQRKNLIIITNALHLFVELSDCPNITLFFLGGRYDIESQTTLGDDVLEQLCKYKVDKLIMGMDGVDPVAGCTSFNHIEDSIMKQMLVQAREKILIVDETKLGKVAFAHVANVSDFDIIVTNESKEKAAIIEALRRTGVKVILA